MDQLAFFKELLMTGPITKQSWTTSLQTNLQRISGKCLPDFQKPFNYAFDNYLHATDVCVDIVDDELYPQMQSQAQSHSQRSQLENLCPACCSREPSDNGYFIFSVDGNFQHSRLKRIGQQTNLHTGRKLFVPNPASQHLRDVEEFNSTKESISTYDSVQSSSLQPISSSLVGQSYNLPQVGTDPSQSLATLDISGTLANLRPYMPSTTSTYDTVRKGDELNTTSPLGPLDSTTDLSSFDVSSISVNLFSQGPLDQIPNALIPSNQPTPQALSTHRPQGLLCNKEDTVLDLKECGRQFRAAKTQMSDVVRQKPLSYEKKDETGLMGAVCRHNIPLRYLNMFEGERYDCTLTLVKEILSAAPLQSKPFLLYDIACKFIPHFKRVDPNWFKRLHGYALNGFHAYAHELKCQLSLGPVRAEGLGRSDGEGCERDWAHKAPLVASLRTTSAEVRMLILDVQSLHQGQLLRQRLGYSLGRRWKAAESQIEASLKTLESLEKKGFAGNRALLIEFLHERHIAEKAYFQHSKASEKLHEFERLKPLYDIITSIEQISNALQRNVQTPMAPSYQQQLQNAQSERDKLLKKFNQTQKQWEFKVGSMFLEARKCLIWIELEDIKQRIQKHSTARALEYSQLRSRAWSSGHKATQKIHQSISRRFPAMTKLTEAFNTLAQQLPEGSRPPKLEPKSFSNVVLEHSTNEMLCTFESQKNKALGIESSEWIYDKDIQHGIDDLLRFERSEEELDLLKQEWKRMCQWTIKRISNSLLWAKKAMDLTQLSWDYCYRRERLIDTVLTVNGLLSCPLKMKDYLLADTLSSKSLKSFEIKSD